ncbi:MAG: phosphoglycerate kinase [Bacilli bacterium]
MNTIKDIDLKNKKVVIRVDYNVPMENGIIKDSSKIKKSLRSINYLLENNCRVVILSHFGRIKSEEDKAKNSLKIVAKELANLLGKNVKFLDNCYGDKVKNIVDNCGLGEVILLENTRFMDIYDKKESGNDLALAEYWASLGEVYINDAFGSMHRAHASTAGIAKFLPHAIGFLVMDELEHLNILIHNTPHPFTVFMGGAKVDDKLPIIKSLIERCDYLLVGGGIANSFLKAKGADIGNSIATSDEGILNELKKLMDEYKGKIVLPVDFTIDDGIIYDVGNKSIEVYKKYIDKSEIVFVNGTCGKFEDERFMEGTSNLFKILKDSGKKVIVGGGDTASACIKFGFKDSFDFISSGGGATLEYIADGTLKALEWME